MPVQLRNFFSTLVDHGRTADIPMIAEVYPLPYRSEAGDWRAWYQGQLKYLWNSNGNHALYDLLEDPRTRNNLYAERKDQGDRLGTALTRYLEALPQPAAEDMEEVELDAETLEALKSLGYTN